MSNVVGHSFGVGTVLRAVVANGPESALRYDVIVTVFHTTSGAPMIMERTGINGDRLVRVAADANDQTTQYLAAPPGSRVEYSLYMGVEKFYVYGETVLVGSCPPQPLIG